MGARDTRNMLSDFAVNKYLHTVASRWILLIYIFSSRRAQNIKQDKTGNILWLIKPPSVLYREHEKDTKMMFSIFNIIEKKGLMMV